MIPFGNEPYYGKKNPTVYSVTSLKTETIKMHQFKSQPKLQSKYIESTP